MSEIPSEKYLRARKFWLFLPVVIVPFLFLFFWLMGGGSVTATEGSKKNGLNTQLPTAQVMKDSVKDKMAFYVAADADSSRRLQQMRMDPYRKDTTQANTNDKPPTFAHTNIGSVAIANKIASIQQQIASSKRQELLYTETKTVAIQKPVATAPDPEMEAINTTLDKLIAIQHPQKSAAAGGSRESDSYSVSAGQESDTTYFGKKNARKNQPAFHNDVARTVIGTGAIAAVVATEQILQSGCVVKLELRVAVLVNGVTLPAGTNVFGTASLEGERLLIHIPSIRFQNNLLPVSLNVYDMDGLEGIYVPGSIARDVAKASADNAIQSAGISGFDLSLKTQAAAAGIGAAKSLLSKKVKQVRVTVAAGYQVLLHDNKQTGQ